MTTTIDTTMKLTRFWLADLLGSLRYSGACSRCRHQFMSVNVYVFRSDDGAKYCERCAGEITK